MKRQDRDVFVDAIILSLIAADRQADEGELRRIRAHVAIAPFASRPVRVTRWLKEQLAQQDIALTKSRLPSVELHLLKRIYVERQWPVGTTIPDYLADLHRAVQHPDVEMWTYRYYSEPMIGFLAPSHRQDVPSPRPFIFVAYNPRYGAIITGYQASGPETVLTEDFEQLRKQR